MTMPPTKARNKLADAYETTRNLRNRIAELERENQPSREAIAAAHQERDQAVAKVRKLERENEASLNLITSMIDFLTVVGRD